MAKKRPWTAGPWRVRYKQTFDDGRKSRPVVEDCHGRKVGNKGADAELQAAAPELLQLVASLLDLAELNALQLASALELSRPVHPPILMEAREAMRRLAVKGVTP